MEARAIYPPSHGVTDVECGVAVLHACYRLSPLETLLRKVTRNMAKTREFGDLLNINGVINVRR